jgi:hypothetical protein
MENFSAHPDRGWNIIKQTIDVSDYYIVIVAGVYGSIDTDTGLSWTEREYDYAVSKSLAVLAFVRSDGSITADKIERDPERQRKLQAFISRLRSKHLCETWDTTTDLCAKVSQALAKRILDDTDGANPPHGWYRGMTLAKVLEDSHQRAKDETEQRVREVTNRLNQEILDVRSDRDSWKAKYEDGQREASEGTITIHRATWGPTDSEFKDVTSIVRTSLEDHRHWLNIPIENAAFGKDPFPNRGKYFTVLFSIVEKRVIPEQPPPPNRLILGGIGSSGPTGGPGRIGKEKAEEPQASEMIELVASGKATAAEVIHTVVGGAPHEAFLAEDIECERCKKPRPRSAFFKTPRVEQQKVPETSKVNHVRLPMVCDTCFTQLMGGNPPTAVHGAQRAF